MSIVNRKSKIVNFTIRVYGIFIKDGRLLLSKEKFANKEMLKFPGGGLEFGEGTIDCLKREMMEEFNLNIEVIDHFYTADFFVNSAFHKDTQVISIYYRINIITKEVPVGIVYKHDNGEQILLWQSISSFNPNILTFPFDQQVGQMILK